MKPASKYVFPFALPQRAINLTAICVVSAALSACGGGSGGGTEVGGSDIDPLTTDLTDSDNDGLTDLEEDTFRTDPFNSDSDGDTLLDGDEVNSFFTDPLSEDTDEDGIFDQEEVDLGTDPNNASDAAEDLDGDGVSNFQEILDGTDPGDATSVIGPDDTTPEVMACDDPDSSNSEWGDNCQLQRFGSFADSLYTLGVQRILFCGGFGNGLSFDAFTDGEFGPGTESSVEQFQAANNLIADGIIGPNTWEVLRNQLSIVNEPDVIIGGLTYTAHTIDGCEELGVQFYQEVDFADLLGWQLAATPGGTDLINFSIDSPF